ncbi:MAG: alkaline phosphatase family protein [Thermoanaerobaculia bacterium]
MRARLRSRLAATWLCLCALSACGKAPAPGPSRLLVLGLDGFDPVAMDRLMREGKLPNLARLRREGAYGPLHVDPPLLSPVVWTTIATGKRPEAHGIGHFTAVDVDGQEIPVTSRMRRVKALWNLFSEAGKKVGVVGWWATWPAEDVNGVVVSDHACYHFLEKQGVGSEVSAALVSPAARMAELLARVRRPADLGAADLAPYAQVTAAELARPFDFADELWHLRWALATAFSYRDLGLKLWREDHPELLMVYLEATDSTAHLFGHLFRQQPLAGELAAQQARYGGTVEAVYALADQGVGQLLAELDARTTLVVLSDHGFLLGELPTDPSKLADMRRVSERYHRDHGVLFLYGHRIRPGTRLEEPQVLDVAPTLLTLAGLPAAADMPGRVLREALVEVPELARVASYEPAGGSPSLPAAPANTQVDQEVIRRLKSLGYLGNASSASNDRNLAFLALKDHRYQEAADAFTLLLAARPEDAALETGLASALAGQGRGEEALGHFARALEIDPIFVPAYHNRAILLERQGKRQEAIADYRRALRYDSDYQPSRQALARLGALVDEFAQAHPEASRKLAESSAAMRRGDYPLAKQLAEEALRLAPRAAAVYQQLANVAYLSGDRKAALEALEKALEIEPENALFRKNIERLRKSSETRL